MYHAPRPRGGPDGPGAETEIASSGPKDLARTLRDGQPQRRGHAGFLLRQLYDRERNSRRDLGDRDHLRAAASWLELAQEVTGDGGVCGRYRLRGGWTSSYPETTGYIIPTFLSLADELGEERFRDRARRCLEFLLPLQLASGAFPGMEVAKNRTVPSPFNTAQILHGLVAWHRATGEERALGAARRAGDWLLELQDLDGAFRRHCYFDVATTYFAHASCWLAELGRHCGDESYLQAAGRHLDWVLGHQDAKTGWFDRCGFTEEDHRERRSVTHTIAYTVWGVLFASIALERPDGVAAARRASEGIARRLELSGRLPGVLDHRWRARADYVCLTGNAQMALIWMKLHELGSSLRLLNAALKAIDQVKAAQAMRNPSPAIRGGIAGSDPAWGGYLYMAIPNWAAKFFVDALLAKQAALAALEHRPRGQWQLPADVPTAIPGEPAPVDRPKLKVVMLTVRDSRRPAQMLDAWSDWGFRPDALVVEQRPQLSRVVRLLRHVRDAGMALLLARLRPGQRAGSSNGAASAPLPDPLTTAERFGIPTVVVPSLASPQGVEAVAAMKPDLAIFAGGGILRKPLLQVPHLGTLNAHMGLLPYYRGMNVVEWAALSGDPVGCTVHLIDSGIDTGDILCVRPVGTDGVRSVAELRQCVNRAQLALLGEALRWIVEHGTLPPRRPHVKDEGVQFFRMHVALLRLLEQELERSAQALQAAAGGESKR
jgi:folate-dependent phosphoribosylglycinamide formyltransferase PurN